MASSYSLKLRLELPATGEQSGTWGTTLNYQMGTLLEQAIAGHATIIMPANADYTLSAVSGALDEARNAVLTITSAVPLTATRAIIIPAVSKTYAVRNQTAGGQYISVKTAAGAGVTIPPGANMVLFCDGTTCDTLAVPYGTGQSLAAGSISITDGFTVAGAAVFNGTAKFNSTVTLAADPGDPLGAATKQYVDNKALPVSGGTVNGNLTVSLPAAPTSGAVFLGNAGLHFLQFDGAAYQMPNASLYVGGSKVLTEGSFDTGGYLAKAGGTMTGALVQTAAGYLRGDSNVALYLQTVAGVERSVLFFDTADGKTKLRTAGGTAMALDSAGLLECNGISSTGSVIGGSFGYFQTPRTADNTFGRAMVNGDNRFGNWMWNDGGGYLQIQVDGVLRSVTAAVSDIRLKEDVRPTQHSALAKIAALDFIDFRYKPGQAINPAATLRGGISAQQAQQIEPGWVHTMPDEEGSLTLNTTLLLTNALQAIKELRAEVAALRGA